jgi:hypothetical protein
MKTTLSDNNDTNVVLYYFPNQKATVVQVRSIRTGVVAVRPVMQAGDRRRARQLGDPIFLEQAECAVSQRGPLPGPDIRGVPQRHAVLCDKNLWPILLELGERENRKPITIGNMILITDLALRSGQAVSNSEIHPVATPSPSELNFESQRVGQQKVLPLIIENRGKPPLTIGSPYFGGPNNGDFSVTLNNCSQPVERKCEVNIGFTPGDTGPRRASLRIPSDGADVPTEIPLLGVGTAPPSPTLEVKVDVPGLATTFPIQKVGAAATQHVPITNTGQATLVINNPSIEGQGKVAFISKNLCFTPIAPRGTCTIDVTFAPQTAAGFTANLLITATEVNPIGTLPRTLAVPPLELKGTAGVPAISTNHPDLCFAKHKVVKNSDPQVRQELSLTISNTGTVPLTVSKIAVSSDDFKVVNESCTASDVAATAGECRVTVGFTPRHSRLREGDLLITNDGTSANPTRVRLKGVGKPRNILARFFQSIFKRTKNPCQ